MATPKPNITDGIHSGHIRELPLDSWITRYYPGGDKYQPRVEVFDSSLAPSTRLNEHYTTDAFESHGIWQQISGP
ncbi:hypothetical protein L1987_48703 [Smallanthus sonchifolius]|uniref:Uncharacterized protein n=1 Tax=Smallanthus sonchifolius TaxID=185202 RepID=A0ACB9FS27_9ASTR|nr:hypothetical protein L1987_48703 [Smallanthus sonchifolius]